MTLADSNVPLDCPPGFNCFEARDPDYLEELSMNDGWQEISYTPLGKGDLVVHYGVRPLPAGAVHTEVFSPDIHVSGRPPRGMTAVGVCWPGVGACRLGGHSLAENQLAVVSDDRDVEFHSLGGTRMLYFDLATERLREAARGTRKTELRALDGRVLTIDHRTMRRLRRLGSALIEADSARSLSELESRLLAELSELGGPASGRGVAPARRGRIVRVAREYIEAHLAEPLRMEHLCAVTGATYRTLHRSFREVCGVGPSVYIKARRLRKARSALLASGSGQTTVAQVALDHGFAHLGRFSRDYHQMFGETPRLTLRSR